MSTLPNSSDPSQTQAELDLLATLFPDANSVNAEGLAYPWNLANGESDAYIAALEQNLEMNALSSEEIAGRSSALFKQLQQCWSRTELASKFAAVPHSILEAIADRAKEILDSPQVAADRLVACVAQLFPEWTDADLQVLARPFAYAMRGTDGVESAIAGVSSSQWSELSQIERVRLSLAAAHYILNQTDLD
ncbi:hypothetical protein IQ235_11460 [Oscillatoriales cyanobacterium LEGE 11467]|uniref:Uncharacterized protein n=1 Tax=Zarconia navalis LEGE 11467 TaxID=1828826 RepID=A0A928VXG5_9CYAN|nr:hypothetical protein [Zarconia navalis]MBE9041399.1 hypothetical protein [Zarconia navalis LEGE 11467]